MFISGSIVQAVLGGHHFTLFVVVAAEFQLKKEILKVVWSNLLPRGHLVTG